MVSSLMEKPGLAVAAPDDRDARDLRWSRLMAAAQAGDRRAYEDLLRECLPLLRQICRARLRDATSADAALDANRAAVKLRDAVQELPESQRTALGLTKLQDLSLQEASARSGMSVGAIKVATHRAMQTLRRRLTGGE